MCVLPSRSRPWGALGLALLLLTVAAPSRASRSPDRPREKDIRAVRKIDSHEGALSWGGLRLGMTVSEAEEVLGEPLPVSEVPRTDVGCEADYGGTVRHKGMSLGLGFDRPGSSGRLREITLILPVPARDDLVQAVKKRFPDLRYVPASTSPDLGEEQSVQPLFRTGSGELILVDPGVGVSFGAVCGVTPAAMASGGG